MMDAATAENVSFAYPDGTPALSGVNFRAGKGEFIGLLASNGSGKTTLLRLLCGLLKPSAGIIEINGKKISGIPKRELFRQLGMVFQNPADQLFAATLAEDVAFGPVNMGFSPGEVKDRVDQAIEDAGLHGLGHKTIQALSYGQQKRACMAGLLAMGRI